MAMTHLATMPAKLKGWSWEPIFSDNSDEDEAETVPETQDEDEDQGPQKSLAMDSGKSVPVVCKKSLSKSKTARWREMGSTQSLPTRGTERRGTN